jgi:GT2 family glycosyltransferase/tetratricopeptide (TPR) repeat protein
VLRRLLDGDWAAADPAGRVRFFTRREIEKLFFRAGFALESLRPVPDPGGGGGDGRGGMALGRLNVRGLSPAAEEEFGAAEYAARAVPRPAPDFGLTSIIVLTHNLLPYTRLCLDSVRRFTDEPYEVIVVDNASADGTPEYLESLAGVTLIRNATNRGFPAAANQGLRAARGRQALLLNNDTVVTTGWLRRMLDALHADPAVGLVGPCSNQVSGGQQVPADYDDDLVGLDGFAWDWGKAHDGRREDADRLVGFCLLVRREVLDRVGLLDERFGVGCFEDDDYTRRALAAGYRAVVARDAFVHHFGGRTFLADRVDYASLLRRNRELYREKWEGGAAAATPADVAPPPPPAGPRVLLVAHVDRLRGRLDKSHYYRYEALARRPGVTLFGPGVEGYRPGMSAREAVAAACGGAWPDVILHGGDLKESGVPLLTGLEEAPALTAIELLDSWTREERQAEFINRHRFAVGLIQEAGPHLESYRARCPGTEFFWTPNAVNTRLFRDWGLPKEYDVIFYGETAPEYYPLRARLLRLLAAQPDIRFLHIPHPGYYPPFDRPGDGVVAGGELSRAINRAWVGIATSSVFRCLLMKYLEIAASQALVAGDMPDHARPLFRDDFLELRMEQSDEEILAALRAELADKGRLAARAAAAHRRVVGEHSTEAFADRTLALFRELVGRRRAAARPAAAPAAPANGRAAGAAGFVARLAPGGGLLLARSDVRLSLCMIVRDNARTLEACLASIRPWVDEMIVVDTGSTDETPRIAARMGARVFHFPWCDSFSAARNESLRHARGRWVFWMDSDDVISADNGRKLRALAEAEPPPGVLGYVMQVHCPGPGPDGDLDLTVVDHVKLFRNLPHLRFEGRIHEQILPAIRRSGGETAWTDVFVVHAGYDHSPEGQERKRQRDFYLLYKDLEDRPEHPFVLFNLGMTHADVGEYDRAADFLERCIRRSGEGESHLRKAYALLAYCRGRLGQAAEARRACEDGLRYFPEDVELRFRRAILFHEEGRLEEAAAAYRAILGGGGRRYFASMDRGICGFKARQNLALVYADQGDLGRAEEQWRLVVQEAPRHRPGWRGLGELLLRRGNAPDAAALADRLLADEALRAEGELLHGQVAAAAGARDEARRRFRAAAAARPDDPERVEVCCRFLFEHGEPAEAEAALARLLGLRPQDASAHHNLGTVYVWQGRAREAAESYQRSVRLRPESAATWLCLGDALRDLGRPGEAAEAWGHAARRDPGGPEAAEALRRAGAP